MDQGQGVGGCPICDANHGHHWTRSQIADVIATFVMEEWYNGDLPPWLQIVIIFKEKDVYITWPDGAGTGLPQPVLPQLPQEHASEEGEDEVWTTETAMVYSNASSQPDAHPPPPSFRGSGRQLTEVPPVGPSTVSDQAWVENHPSVRIDDPAEAPAPSTPPRAPSPDSSPPAPALEQTPPPAPAQPQALLSESPIIAEAPAVEETGKQQEDRSAPPEVTPPGLAPTHQQNFTRLWETCLLKIASQPPEEQEYALKRVIAAAYALASPQDESHSDLARAEAETIRNGYFIGLDVPPAQPPAEPAAPPAAQPAVAEPASPAPTLPPASGPSEAPPDASSEPLEPRGGCRSTNPRGRDIHRWAPPRRRAYHPRRA